MLIHNCDFICRKNSHYNGHYSLFKTDDVWPETGLNVSGMVLNESGCLPCGVCVMEYNSIPIFGSFGVALELMMSDPGGIKVPQSI